MTEPTTAQRLKELGERLAGLEWAQAEPGPQWANDLVQRRIDQTRRKITRLSVIREALSEPTEEMLTAAIYAEGPMRPTVGEALAAKWKAMIAASPIGEK